MSTPVVHESNEIIDAHTGEVLSADTPAAFMERAQDMASRLDDVVRKQRLDVDIQGKRYLRVEAWQFLAGMAQLTPRTREIETVKDGEKAVGARVYVELVRDSDCAVIGGAYGRCDYSERIGRSGAYAAESMAQTRATSKAISQKLRFIPVLAGYQGTPLEEMPAREPAPRKPRKKPPYKTDEQLGEQRAEPAWDSEELDSLVKGKQRGEVSTKDVSTEVAGKVSAAARDPGGSVEQTAPPTSVEHPEWIDEVLPKLRSRPNWKGKTWRWLLSAKPTEESDRFRWVNAVIDNPDAPRNLKLRCEYILMRIHDQQKADTK